ncbi:putative nucleotide-diphospho-sugar transferase [Psychromarinibacter sp. C21-152]|uniref:Nucleotide-diphospho-sugar transferase n=1 Tax=Psychromarinibacter sediminicola TaxID=3033385 RepID=A0AAE3T9J8_9RHOB|nr:putative nucleotide-diphospho-sugar transferase [Psychromarinibacter sediminicola]MDF0602287.1 putative nucleotide-diphospho-sugar transferase [Psychromarinibacter sediminicola]
MNGAAPSRGFVFAATGPGFTEIAGRAAESVRSVHPDGQIDLFTDQPEAAGVFDRVHPLTNVSVRPKFEALLRSRFDRTIYIDADTRMIAPVGDVFDLLDRFDIAAAQDEGQNNPNSRRFWRTSVPAAFPQYNTGVIAVRRSEATDRLFAECDRAFRENGLEKDQPVFRELLYLSDFRIATLPMAYNCMFVRLLAGQDHEQIAPRILHLPRLHQHLSTKKPQLVTARDVVGPLMWRHILRMRRSDMTLDGKRYRKFAPLMDHGPLGRLHRGYRDWLHRRALRASR